MRDCDHLGEYRGRRTTMSLRCGRGSEGSCSLDALTLHNDSHITKQQIAEKVSSRMTTHSSGSREKLRNDTFPLRPQFSSFNGPARLLVPIGRIPLIPLLAM